MAYCTTLTVEIVLYIIQMYNFIRKLQIHEISSVFNTSAKNINKLQLYKTSQDRDKQQEVRSYLTKTARTELASSK